MKSNLSEPLGLTKPKKPVAAVVDAKKTPLGGSDKIEVSVMSKVINAFSFRKNKDAEDEIKAAFRTASDKSVTLVVTDEEIDAQADVTSEIAAIAAVTEPTNTSTK